MDPPCQGRKEVYRLIHRQCVNEAINRSKATNAPPPSTRIEAIKGHIGLIDDGQPQHVGRINDRGIGTGFHHRSAGKAAR